MTWRHLNRLTAGAAVVAAAAAGVAFGATVLDDEEARSSRGPAAREPLREAPLLAPARGAENDQGVEAEERRAAQLGFPEPSEYRPGSPDRALASFLAAWRDRRFDVMETWTAAGSGPDASPAALRRRFGPSRLRGWRVLGRTRGSRPGILDFRTEIAHRTLLEPQLRRSVLELRLARRTPDGDLDPVAGAWGVDPLPRLSSGA